MNIDFEKGCSCNECTLTEVCKFKERLQKLNEQSFELNIPEQIEFTVKCNYFDVKNKSKFMPY